MILCCLLNLTVIKVNEVAQPAFWADAQIVIVGQEEAELVGNVGKLLVEGRGGERDGELGVLRDVVAESEEATALAVPQVVAFVHDNEAVADELRQIVHGLAEGEHAAP